VYRRSRSYACRHLAALVTPGAFEITRLTEAALPTWPDGGDHLSVAREGFLVRDFGANTMRQPPIQVVSAASP
jgi:hypothetical protein